MEEKALDHIQDCTDLSSVLVLLLYRRAALQSLANSHWKLPIDTTRSIKDLD